MHVEVDHEYAARAAGPADGVDCEHRVVEQAVAAAPCAPRVVGAAAEVRGDARIQRVERGRDGRARAVTGAQHQLGRPGKAERPLLAVVEPAVAHAVHPAGIVNPCELIPVERWCRLDRDAARELALDRLARERVLAGGKPVPWRQRNRMLVVRVCAHSAP